MARLGEALAQNRAVGRGSLLAYLMVGSVERRRLLRVIRAFAEAGVTGIELGFPFSDPMAEGPVIQRAASDALQRGTHWPELFETMEAVASELPVALMTYLNPILQLGVERALERISAAGGSALILPDLPYEEASPFRRLARRTGVDTVLLASPATGKERVEWLAETTSGFLYMVSRYGVTGSTGVGGASSGVPSLPALIEAVHTRRRELPVLAGFGVSGPRDVKLLRKAGADGVIVGSAFQRLLSEGTPAEKLGDVARSLVAAL